MIRIAIVDDDEYTCKKLKDELTKYSIQEDKECIIEVYLKCEDISEELMSGKEYDIIFLDIEFEDMMNGIELGDFIRNKLLNAELTIIFISSIEGYAKQLFKIHPFDFLVKPLTYEKVKTCIDSYYKTNYLKYKYFHFTKNKGEHNISVLQIKYLQSKGKKVIVHTQNEDVEFYGQLSNVITQKCFEKFIVIHQSYIVNPIYIERFGFDYVIIKNNITLPVSRVNQNKVRDFLMNF